MRFKSIFEHQHPALEAKIAEWGARVGSSEVNIFKLNCKLDQLEGRVKDLEEGQPIEGIPWPNPKHKKVPPKSKQGADWDRDAERQFDKLWDEFLDHAAGVTGRTRLAIWFHLKNGLYGYRP